MPLNEFLSRLWMKVPKDAQSLRKSLPVLMIVVGLVLLGYVGTQYGTMYWEQRQLAREWAQQQKMQQEQMASGSPAPVDDGLTRLSIPKIEFSAVVVEGTTRKKLLLGPGHLENTPMPGSEGNSVITAHRDTFFRHIYQLTKGDELIVQRSGKTFKYEVTEKKIVQPTEISVLKPTKDTRLTLITCYPTYYIGPAPERLVIVSKLKEGDAASAAAPASVSAQLPEDTSNAAKQ